MDKRIWLEHRQHGWGLNAAGVFVPFLKEGEAPGVIVCMPWDDERVKKEMSEYVNLVLTKGTCSRCGCVVSVAGSSRKLLKQFPETPLICIKCCAEEIKNKGGP